METARIMEPVMDVNPAKLLEKQPKLPSNISVQKWPTLSSYYNPGSGQVFGMSAGAVTVAAVEPIQLEQALKVVYA
jgi:hypothetical protein